MLIIVLAGIIVSCGGGRGSFNKQKYTNLNGKTSYPTENNLESKNDPAVVSFKAEENPALSEEITEGGKPELSIEELIAPAEPLNELMDQLETPIQSEKPEIKNTHEELKDDEPEKDKSESMAKYNEWWNISILIFLLGSLFVAMTIFAVSPLMYYVCLSLGPVLVLVAWVLSIYMITLGKKVAPKDRDSSFKLKNTLAWLLAIGGPAGLLIIGGLILLLILLWL